VVVLAEIDACVVSRVAVVAVIAGPEVAASTATGAVVAKTDPAGVIDVVGVVSVVVAGKVGSTVC
jgi:hypothetical protein